MSVEKNCYTTLKWIADYGLVRMMRNSTHRSSNVAHLSFDIAHKNITRSAKRTIEDNIYPKAEGTARMYYRLLQIISAASPPSILRKSANNQDSLTGNEAVASALDVMTAMVRDMLAMEERGKNTHTC